MNMQSDKANVINGPSVHPLSTHIIVSKNMFYLLKSTAYQYYQHHEDEVMLLHGVDEMIISFFTLLSE